MRTLAGVAKTRRAWAVMGVAVAAGVAGCGGGDSKLAVGEPTKDAAAYCAKSLAIETYPDPDIDFETASPEEIQTGVRAYTAAFLPLAEDAVAVAPAGVKADIGVLVDALRTVTQTGDFSIFETDSAVAGADAKVHAFELDNCGWGKADITGTEYSFDGLPKKVEPGPVSFDLANKGKEAHEIVVFRVNDGVSQSLDELLALPDEEAFSKVELVGTVEPTDPGDHNYDVVILTPGRYGVACFIPIGDSGPPHFTEGMKGEFTVA